MSNDTELSDAELITALEEAGYVPEPALIDEILTRRDTLAEPLAALILGTLDESYTAGDDRYYAMIHAARILLYWREPLAIPAFATLFLHDEDAVDWFQDQIAVFGPDAVRPFSEVLLSDTGTDWHYGKASMADVLAYIAMQYPETRPDVLAALHATLPTLREDGSVDWPEDQDPDENWISVIGALALLQDKSSREVALALFDADVLETFMMNREDYLHVMKEGGTPPKFGNVSNLPTEVREAWNEEQSRLRRVEREAEARKSREASLQARDQYPKVGRNEPCPCGSGKKYKHCHGKKR